VPLAIACTYFEAHNANLRRAEVKTISGPAIHQAPQTCFVTEFKIGQYVSYQRHKAEGRFVVIRLLPQPKGEPGYVIRSEDEPECEASELRRVPSGR
jgi:hypothetical protein